MLTEAFRDNILARGLVDPSKICFIPNGVDTDGQRPDLRSERLREELGWAGRFVVLYSGAHGVANRVGQLLDAAELLRDRPEILIATVGGGMELEPLRRAGSRARAVRTSSCTAPGRARRCRRSPPRPTPARRSSSGTTRSGRSIPTRCSTRWPAAGRSSSAIDGAARDLVERAGPGLFAEPENPRRWPTPSSDSTTTARRPTRWAAAGASSWSRTSTGTALALRYLDELRGGRAVLTLRETHGGDEGPGHRGDRVHGAVRGAPAGRGGPPPHGVRPPREPPRAVARFVEGVRVGDARRARDRSAGPWTGTTPWSTSPRSASATRRGWSRPCDDAGVGAGGLLLDDLAVHHPARRVEGGPAGGRGRDPGVARSPGRSSARR